MGQIAYRIMQQPESSGDRTRAAWVASLMPGAEPTALKLGVSPEAIIAQAALETGWGKSAIGNNIFGIKAHGGWTGKVQEIQTWEHIDGKDVALVDKFRDYDSIADSFADHFRFLEVNTRYRDAGVFARAGDLAYFQALKRGGYATDPAYVDKLVAILGMVKGYTAGMERIELAAPKGYEVLPGGNVVNPDPKRSTILRDARRGGRTSNTVAIAGAVAPVVAAFTGMDWKLAAVIGAILVGGGLVAAFYFRSIRNKRIEMAEQGVV